MNAWSHIWESNWPDCAGSINTKWNKIQNSQPYPVCLYVYSPRILCLWYLYILHRVRRILAWAHSIWIPFTHAHTYPLVQVWKLSPLFSVGLSEYWIWIWCNFLFLWPSPSRQKTAALYQGENFLYSVTGSNPLRFLCHWRILRNLNEIADAYNMKLGY